MKLIAMKWIATTILCTFVLMAAPAWSICKEAPVPVLPNPDFAVETEMLRAQEAVRHYLAVQENFLSCVRNDRRHNQALDRMHMLAEKYNRITRRYKVRKQSMGMFTDLALLGV